MRQVEFIHKVNIIGTPLLPHHIHVVGARSGVTLVDENLTRMVRWCSHTFDGSECQFRDGRFMFATRRAAMLFKLTFA